MIFADMKTGVPYIVTRESDDGSLVVGDQITLLPGGELANRQAEGWIEPDDLLGAATGMECVVDTALIERRKEALRRRLADLETLE